jgi:hypothetical protein
LPKHFLAVSDKKRPGSMIEPGRPVSTSQQVLKCSNRLNFTVGYSGKTHNTVAAQHLMYHWKTARLSQKLGIYT